MSTDRQKCRETDEHSRSLSEGHSTLFIHYAACIYVVLRCVIITLRYLSGATQHESRTETQQEYQMSYEHTKTVTEVTRLSNLPSNQQTKYGSPLLHYPALQATSIASHCSQLSLYWTHMGWICAGSDPGL